MHKIGLNYPLETVSVQLEFKARDTQKLYISFPETAILDKESVPKKPDKGVLNKAKEVK